MHAVHSSHWLTPPETTSFEPGRIFKKWYNDGMERVSGWYKRRTRYIVFVLGFVVASGINANTVDIARTLANNAAVRTA
jgi:hypothetical protein